MFAFSRASEYALLALTHMARKGGRSPVSVAAMARELALPKGYLAKIMPQLIRAGIVRSARGAAGGFVLDVSPDDITLRDVVLAVDGPVHVARCMDPEDGCEFRERCAVTGMMRRVQDRILAVLDECTLSDNLNGSLPAPGERPTSPPNPVRTL